MYITQNVVSLVNCIWLSTSEGIQRFYWWWKYFVRLESSWKYFKFLFKDRQYDVLVIYEGSIKIEKPKQNNK